MKLSIIEALGCILIGALAMWIIRNPKLEPRIVVRLVPDSVAVHLARLEADSLRGRIEQQQLAVSNVTRESFTWRARADRYRRLYEDMESDTSSTVTDQIAALDTVLATKPDSAGHSYLDTLMVRYSLATELWKVGIGFDTRVANFNRRDSTIFQPYAVAPWWTWPAIAIAAILGAFVRH